MNKLLLSTAINTVKNVTFGSILFSALFSLLSWFVLGLNVDMSSIIILIFIFVLSYVTSCFLFILEWQYKKIYCALLIVTTLLFTFTLSKAYFLSFFALHRGFYSLYGRIMPPDRKIKIQQKLFIFKQKIDLWINNLKINPKTLFKLNLSLTLILLFLYYLSFVNIEMREDTLIQINITIYAFILPLSLSIVTSNEYSKISKYYSELYQGWNFLFFSSYLLLIIFSVIYPNGYISILSIFMMVNTFVFILNLTEQTSHERIIERLLGKLQNEINKGNYNLIRTSKSEFSWKAVNGFDADTRIIDKNKDFEYTIDLLNQLAVKAIQNKDRDTFTKIIRGYFNLSRFFLRVCKKEDKGKITTFLSQITAISMGTELDDEFFKILINEIIYDYGLHEYFIDIRILNLERFKLMIYIAEKNEKDKDRFNYIVSGLIEMLIIRIMEGKFGPIITHNGFSNTTYLQFKDTDEFKELRKLIRSKRKKLDKSRIRKNLEMYTYESEIEQNFFVESKRNVLKELNLDKYV